MHIFINGKYISSMALTLLSLSVLTWIDQSFPRGVRPGATDLLSHPSL